MTVTDNTPVRPAEPAPGSTPTDSANGPQEANEPPAGTVWSAEPYPPQYAMPCPEWEPIPGLPDRFNTLKRQEWSAYQRIAELTVSPASIAANAAELTDLADRVKRIGAKADRVLNHHFSSRGL